MSNWGRNPCNNKERSNHYRDGKLSTKIVCIADNIMQEIVCYSIKTPLQIQSRIIY